jgi:hypothetical protein
MIAMPVNQTLLPPWADRLVEGVLNVHHFIWQSRGRLWQNPPVKKWD